MACEDKGLLLHAYLDGELDLVHSLELEEHLKACAGCARKLEHERTLKGALRAAALYHRSPRALGERVRAAVASETSESTNEKVGAGAIVPWPGIRSSGERRSRLEIWIGIAAVVLVALAVSYRLISSSFIRSGNDLIAQEVVAGHIRSMQPGHLFDVQSSDQHTVKPWFDGKLDFAPPVRDFTDQGFALIGGRLDYIGNHSVGALIYQRRKHVINVFIWPESSGDSTHTPGYESQRALNGYNLVGWRQDAMYLWAVSDLNAEELHQLVQLFKHVVSK